MGAAGPRNTHPCGAAGRLRRPAAPQKECARDEVPRAPNFATALIGVRSLPYNVFVVFLVETQYIASRPGTGEPYLTTIRRGTAMTIDNAVAAHDLFISYAEADRAWVDGFLIDALEQAGVKYHSEDAFSLGVP